MATKSLHTTLQPSTFQILDEIEKDFCKEEVLVRLIHCWEARNFKKGNMLIGLELLLLDSKSNAVQGFISAHRLFRHEQNLKPNSVYKLSKFMTTPPKKNYKVSSYKHGICFTDKTTMIPVTHGDHNIDEQKFRLRTFNDFSAIADTSTELFDAIGQIRLISGDNLHSPTTMENTPEVEGTRSKDKVLLHLLMKDGETLRIYLWETIAAKFRERWNRIGTKPAVLLITTVNPKTFGGALTLSSTSATRLFFDNDTEETKQFMAWLGETGYDPPTIASSSLAITKLETVTVNEIYQFLQNENPQTASFYCFATIVDIVAPSGWYYISCNTCNTKLETKSPTTMSCNTCKKDNNVALIRYRFEITVRDKHENEAIFVVFDQDGTNLAGRRAVDVLNEAIEAVGNDEAQGIYKTTPECLKHIIGYTCKFQIRLTSYNFRATRQTITVSRFVETNIGLEEKPTEENLTAVDSECVIVAPIGKAKERKESTNPEDFTRKNEKRPRLDN